MRLRILLFALLAAVVLWAGIWLARRAAEKARVESRRSSPVAEAPEPQGIRVFGSITAGGAPAEARIVAHGSERSLFASGDSDEQGAYELHVPEPGLYSFWIRLEEEVVSVELTEQVVGLEEQRIDIEIPIGSIEGHVHGPDGPAGGVPVDLVAFEADSHAKTAATAKTTTDENGRYAIERVPAGSWVIQAGEGASYEPPLLYTTSKLRKVTVARGQRLSGVDLSVGAAGIVSGRVLTAKGSPAEVAVLKLRHLSGDALGFTVGSCESDSEGRFELGGIKPGSYRLVAFYGLRQGAEAQIVVEPSQELEVELRTAPATLVRLLLRSPDDGAQVTCMRSDGVNCTRWLTYEADMADDEEVFGPLLPGTYTFTVDRDGLPPSSQTVTLDAEREFRLEL